ncbi:hypothetical protein [Streptomyces sp. NPDC048636]|uniref:hypothetical protein n=1 Tax=Streptomyces sp. NPDC048636 TaxID=3155762 RepID=UPI00343C169D
MRLRPLATTSATLLMTATLALSLTACDGDSDTSSSPKTSRTAADGHAQSDRERSADSAASGSEGGSGSSGSSSGGTTGGSSTGTGGGTADNTQHVALPLPEGARLDTVSGQDDSSLLLQYTVNGSLKDAESTLAERFMKNGYEDNEGALTRGHQRLTLDTDGGTLNLMVTLPKAEGYLPLPPQGQLKSVQSKADDTLVFSYGRAADENSSLSTLKTYIPELQDDGWNVPTDGGAHFTKGRQAIDADMPDQNTLELAVHLPSSVD